MLRVSGRVWFSIHLFFCSVMVSGCLSSVEARSSQSALVATPAPTTIPVGSASPPPAQSVVYLSPVGSDKLPLDPADRSGPGFNRAKPFKTLDHAVSELVRNRAQLKNAFGKRVWIVHYLTGTYYNQKLVYNEPAVGGAILLDDSVELTIEGDPGVIIDGRRNATILSSDDNAGDRDRYFQYFAPNGAGGKLIFRGLTIQHYLNPIDIEASRIDWTHAIHDVLVDNIVFREIGNQYWTCLTGSGPGCEKRDAFAAVHTANVDHSTFSNNQFLNLLNDYDVKLLHAIYLTSDSSDNLITRNRFEQMAHAVRLRNHSSRNSILANNFRSVLSAASDYYCVSTDTETCDCAKASPNYCPSTNHQDEVRSMANVLSGNSIYDDSSYIAILTDPTSDADGRLKADSTNRSDAAVLFSGSKTGFCPTDDHCLSDAGDCRPPLGRMGSQVCAVGAWTTCDSTVENSTVQNLKCTHDATTGKWQWVTIVGAPVPISSVRDLRTYFGNCSDDQCATVGGGCKDVGIRENSVYYCDSKNWHKCDPYFNKTVVDTVTCQKTTDTEFGWVTSP